MDFFITRLPVVVVSTVCRPFSGAQMCLLNSRSAGEVCYEWQSWSTYLGFRSIFGSSLLQAFVYVALAVSCTI